MKKYNSPLEKKKNYEINYISDITTMFALSGMAATSILTDLTNDFNFKLLGIPGIAILCYGIVGITGGFAFYNHNKSAKMDEKIKRHLKMKINMLSKEELQELKNMLNNKDLMKLAEEVRDNNLENLLETRENQINEMEATQNTYTEAKAGRTYHK